MKWTTILALLVVVAMVAEARLTPEERAQKRADKQAAKAARRANKPNKGERHVRENILSFRTNWPWQTAQTQTRLLLEEQSDLGLHCLLFH